MKHLLFLPVLLLACTLSSVPVSENAPLATQAIPLASETAVPSATVGYVETQVVLEQAALDAAQTNVAFESLHVGATVQASQLTAQSDGWTREAALREDEYFKATGTAYQTVIPATQTAQAIIQTAHVIRSTELAITLDAPTLIVSMAEAESAARFAPYRDAGETVAIWSLPVMVLALVAFVVRSWAIPTRVGNETFHVLKDSGADLVHVDEAHAEQLRELAIGVFRQGKKLSYKYWQNRKDYSKFRQWMADMKLVTVSETTGEATLTDAGKEIVRAHLPTSPTPKNGDFSRQGPVAQTPDLPLAGE